MEIPTQEAFSMVEGEVELGFLMVVMRETWTGKDHVIIRETGLLVFGR